MGRKVNPNSKRSKLLRSRENPDRSTPQWIIDTLKTYAEGKIPPAITMPTGGTATNQRQRFYTARQILSLDPGPFQHMAMNAIGLILQVRCTACNKDPRWCPHGKEEPVAPAQIQFLGLPPELMQGTHTHEQAQTVTLPEVDTEGLPTSQFIEKQGKPSYDAAEEWVKQYISQPAPADKGAPAACAHEANEYDVCILCGKPKEEWQ